MENAIRSAMTALKPDFEEVGPERIKALLESQPETEGEVEVFDTVGGGAGAGASSGIVIFSARVNGATNDYVLRYAPYNNELRIFAEYDIANQFHLHRILSERGLPVPEPVACDANSDCLPLPGFIMERVDGEVPDTSAYTTGLFAKASEAQRAKMHDGIFAALGQVHSVDWQRLGLEKYCCSAGGRTPIERYLNWYWKTAEWSGFPSIDRLQRCRQWLFDNQPSYHSGEWTLVHGDANLANYMFRNDRLVAILDWELAGIGSPSMDIALQVNFNEYCRMAAPPDVQNLIPTEQAWKTRYEKVTGRRLADYDYFRKLMCFTGLIILTSMNRGVPEAHKAAHAQGYEWLWAIVESGWN
ncbi:MAG: phosphotransferase family protein [Gammaproteobacteria bacterium]|nr:phosphotransferase family protein [Gammaproteobacteria bacterium]MDE0366404.1 phosphotransferase family protein [Gammaproteobacteria bacterium]